MCEENSNFHQLLKLRAQANPEIIEWLRKRDEKYTSPGIQIEMLEAMALGMMRQISANIQNATFFTIMVDETADVSNKEQLVICVRWVDDWFVIHEDFIRSRIKRSDLNSRTIGIVLYCYFLIVSGLVRTKTINVKQ